MGTHHRGTRREVRALDTYIKLMRAAESVSARVARHVIAVELTMSQFGVLEALFHLGPLCQRDLGLKILKSGGDISVVVDNLEKRGLVKRKRESDDRRLVTVHLTSEGDQVIRDIFPRHVRAIVAEMSVLTASQQEELGRLCRRLGLQEKRKTRAATGASSDGF